MDVAVTLIAAVIGLVGVVVGVTITERAERRRVAHGAARLAVASLEQWVKAVRLTGQAPVGPSEQYDALLAIHLRSVRQHLDMSWWHSHAVQLSTSADDNQWGVLVEASRLSSGILMRIDRLGDVGIETLEAHARVRPVGGDSEAETSVVQAEVDRRLVLVRETAEAVARTQETFRAAIEVCRSIRAANEKLFGLLPLSSRRERRPARSPQAA